MNKSLRPNDSELEFLSLAYNRFYGIFDEINNDAFWKNDAYYRFSKVKDIFYVYAELLNYEPIKWVISELKTNRPPMEAEIGSNLFKFIRNVFSHFPFFDCWNDVWITKSIVNWYKEGQTIDRYLENNIGRKEIKYRFWDSKNKKMTYLSINFPERHHKETRIYLKDILTEQEGILFSIILMKNILDSQIVQEE